MNPGDQIDGKYLVLAVHSSSGGMGEVLRVMCLKSRTELILKYCRSSDAEPLDRFRREIRLMGEFVGNSKVVQIHDSNLTHTPPFYVMPLYADGDLRSIALHLTPDPSLQEKTFLEMAACVAELHNRGKFHRDIKPANFLRGTHGIVVSDLGLGTDTQSATAMTLSHQQAGTFSFMPPEFFSPGGFKNATAQSDIFMLGKSFYNLVTGLDPLFIDKARLQKPLLHLVEQCCALDPAQRIQTISDLMQAIVTTYDLILGRMDPAGQAQATYAGIVALLAQRQYKSEEFEKFVQLASALSSHELFAIVQDADKDFYFVLSQPQLQTTLEKYLDLYEAAVLAEPYLNFSYAETVAKRMRVVFDTSTNPDLRAKALEFAIVMAARMNRFAAMSTVSNMITGTPENDPAQAEIVAVLHRQKGEDFIASIEASSCKNQVIADQLRKLSGASSPSFTAAPPPPPPPPQHTIPQSPPPPPIK